jgi:ELWxxDGT repeat protein
MFRFVNTRTKSRCRTRQRSRPPRLEVLEDRTLPSAMLVKDLNPGSADSNPRYLSDINHTLFFGADDGVHGRELWKSDGTAGGTQLVKDIVPGAASSDPSSAAGQTVQPMANVNGTVYFLASDAAGVRGLYKSGGTADTTTLVRAFPGVAAPSYLTAFQNKLFFVGSDATNPLSLWVSDGTTAGTMPFPAGTTPPKLTSFTGNLAVFDNQLFFDALNPATNTGELWVSDGTAAGTKVFKVLNGANGSSPADMTVFQNKLYFTATLGTDRQVWVSDGTPAGTVPVTSFTRGNTAVHFVTVVNHALYFVAQLSGTTGTGNFLYKSDGTATGTTQVAALNVPSDLTGVNDRLFFTDTDSAHGRELWTSDGTAAGTHLVKDLLPGPSGSGPDSLIGFNNKLYFSAKDSAGKLQLWFSDGTDAGTAVEPIAGTFGAGPSPDNLTVSNGNLFFSANDGANGNELWVLQGSTQGGNPPAISINSVTVKAGDNAVFTVTLSAASSLPVSVQYFTSYDTALVGGDYDPVVPTVLTFAPDQTSKTITVGTHQRLQFYDQGTFFVRLQNPVNASLSGSAVGTGTIVHGTKVDTTIPDDLQLFVRQLYIDLLGRVVEPGGLSYWVGLLRAGASKESVVSGIAQSAEHLSYEVRQAYQRFLQRPVEDYGLAFWTSALQSGTTLQEMQAGILASAEYFQGRGGNTVPSYLQSVYTDTLGRGLDPVGQAYWSGLLGGGQARQDVAEAILVSPEAAGQLVTSTYFQFVRHAPDPAGFAYWVGRLEAAARSAVPAASAATRGFPITRFPGFIDPAQFAMLQEQLREALAKDSEYSRILFSDTLLNTWWLQKLYPDLLGRPLDNVGLVVWLGQLSSGISRDSVAAQIETEPMLQEARKHAIDRLYHQLLGRPDTTPTSGAEISDGLSRITNNDYDPVRAHIMELPEFAPYGFLPDAHAFELGNHIFVTWLVRLVFDRDQPMNTEFDLVGDRVLERRANSLSNPVPRSNIAMQALTGSPDPVGLAAPDDSDIQAIEFDLGGPPFLLGHDSFSWRHQARTFLSSLYFQRFLGVPFGPDAESVFDWGMTGCFPPVSSDPNLAHFSDIKGAYVDGGSCPISEEQFLANIFGLNEYMRRHDS